MTSHGDTFDELLGQSFTILAIGTGFENCYPVKKIYNPTNTNYYDTRKSKQSRYQNF